MPPRKAPTVRQRRLGAELRRLRERAGLGLTDAAPLLGTDRTTISNTESGRFGVSAERVRAWAAHYGASDHPYVEALAAMAGERSNGWWEDYRGELPAAALDLAELEHHAVAIRAVQIMHLPGLLQTEDYVRAVFAQAVPPPEASLARRQLSYRLRRRDVLGRPQPPMCTFMIHEAALRMVYGERATSLAQLSYLLDESERDNVHVRIIPFAAGGFPNAGSSTHYLSGPVTQLDTVQMETATGSAFVDAETPLGNYRAVLDRTQERSLGLRESRDFVRKIAQDI
ncbi:helix-turn-helix domain-containing protein [Streptomyces fuscigenes]|uniref:helix-turn-helix domain-containing protein n=1 Tax=Streptomyces fuscigenes TaxID=1528880 RepID=UPI001F1CE79A|nr:helix-turn-helix transcriptional regulator [Streptomyces fuscigenes]MCF3960528.1 helix-turn-helix domain-containing protein [Streptomyces fuscigenes]